MECASTPRERPGCEEEKKKVFPAVSVVRKAVSEINYDSIRFELETDCAHPDFMKMSGQHIFGIYTQNKIRRQESVVHDTSHG